MQGLEWYWPSPKGLETVQMINALRQSTAVAMAVHQPMDIHRRDHDKAIGTTDYTVVQERAVLEHLLRETQDGVQVVLVEGAAGTGKSHLVKWLNIQLEESADAGRYVVLLVEKGSRLRDIVGLLCQREELQGEVHRELREKLLKARQPIAPEHAAHRLRSELAYVCEQLHEEAKKKRAQPELGALTDAEAGFLVWGQPKMLPALLMNVDLRPQWTGPGRCIPRVIANLDTLGTQDKPRATPLFEPDDLCFELPDALDGEVRNCLARLEHEKYRTGAATTLNHALDEAKGILLGLHPGDVLDVFKSIRASLSGQDKELVILIEDFADLSGLQKEILQACIMDAAQDANRTICTVRSVIAYTDNYLQENTVKSRAQHIYYVPKGFAESGRDETAIILDKAVDLIARYLHAARIGQEDLHKAYRDRSHAQPERAWIPEAPLLMVAEPDQETLARLEREKGILLFPFNRTLIRALLRNRYGENLAFNPRDIIMGLMKDVLEHRADFLEGAFPSNALANPRSIEWDEDRDIWFSRSGGDERLKRFLAWWGCDPATARAFGIRLGQGTPTPPLSDPRETKPEPRSGEPAPQPREEFGSTETRNLLKKWREKTPILNTTVKRNWRIQMGEALESSLPWAWVPRRRPAAEDRIRWKGWAHSIDIAGIGPDRTALAMAPLVDQAAWEDPARGLRLSQEILAVVEAPPGGTWDFPGAEAHVASHMSFVERYRPGVQDWMQQAWHSRHWDALPWFIGALTCSAGAFGTPFPRKKKDLKAFLEYLFDPAPESALGGNDPYAAELQAWKENREQVQKLLEQEIGAFQRTGGTVHALDVTRLLPHLPDARTAGPPDLPIEPQLLAKAELAAAIKFPAGRLSSTCARNELTLRREAFRQVQEHLGQEPQMAILLEAVDTFRSVGIETTHLDAGRNQHLQSSYGQLRRLPVAGVYEASRKLAEDANSGWEAMLALGRHQAHARSLATLRQALVDINSEVLQIENHADVVGTPNPLDQARAVHTQHLTDLLEQLGVETSECMTQEQP